MYKNSIKFWMGVGIGILPSRRKDKYDNRYVVYYLVLPIFLIRLYKIKKYQPIHNLLKSWSGIGFGLLISKHINNCTKYLVLPFVRIKINHKKNHRCI